MPVLSIDWENHRLARGGEPLVNTAMLNTPGSLTQRGVNVNIKLLFSIERYEQVIDAYQRGLSARVDAGEPLEGIRSVASFFLSRIDTKVDPHLSEGSPLRGHVALASARVAYQRYRAKFAADAWERLAGAGAARQRPLWRAPGPRTPTTQTCSTSQS